MVSAFWIQYPLGTDLNWEFISNRIRTEGTYFLFNHAALPFKEGASKIYSYFELCTRFYSEIFSASQLRFLPISFFIIRSILYVFLLIVCLGLYVFVVVPITIPVIFIFVRLLGLQASFLVWLLLYRIPVYDLIYPRIRTWMLRRNSRIYHRLLPGADISTSYIRLVRINPGNDSHKIECELITENIARADFDALSYVWGISIFPCKIKVNGSDFYVTYNLVSALRKLRRPDRHRVVWIDALCINQSDDVEKSSQVRLMKTIYSKASEVIVWLGTGSKVTTAAFNFIRQFSNARTEEDCNYVWAKVTSSWGWWIIRKELNAILSHEWWTRAWIIQEVAVARHILIQRGSAQLAWDDIQHLFRYGPFQKVFRLQSSIFFANEVQQLRNELTFDNPGSTTLFGLVYRFRHQFATLGSDKIYAILGLLPPGCCTSVFPDYSKSTEQVFLDFTLASLAEDKTFAVVALAPEAALEGVSWCCDWRIPNHNFRPRDCFSMYKRPSMRNYCAAGESEPRVEADMSQRVLKVKGFELDAIARRAHYEFTFNSVARYLTLKLVLSGWERIAGGPWPLSSEEDLASSKSFNRTITANRWAEDVVDWKTEVEVMTPYAGPKEGSYAKAILRVGVNRRFFVTQKGKFGLGPLDLEEGDVLVAVLGSVVPLVLRKDNKHGRKRHIDTFDTYRSFERLVRTRNMGEESKEEFWKVIGEAYCDGLMYYEGDIDNDIHDGKVKIRDYNLR
ncbi:heterokaryon incompatibility protein-domain-containing protein [Hypoxylon rubiginosum]|uniref:Heterokaryon incompatibility protein-domain-containing protein n=1 Tax=Hypoxylon rubiginosum TaxID=110542 RepID=A0ACC0D734_9PEZI|nr:heterokaryon incompatibility protein-domain-containing protein [Hypoxylon rubiginosum]